mgnify:CR=1 FL=1
MKDVIISIVDKHEAGGESVSSELITVGTFCGDENDYSLTYKEQDESLLSCTTTLRVQNKNKITMTRCGDFMTEMVIEQGKRHNCHYTTPAGNLFMGVFAKKVESKINHSGGSLFFSYTIDFNSDFASFNELNVTVREVTKNVPLS